MHIDDVEGHECTVNISELAAHARALQRSKHQLLSITVTPSVSTLFGGKQHLARRAGQNIVSPSLRQAWAS